MIEDPPLLTIRRKFPRPPASLVAALAGTPTGYLVDCMGGRGALDHTIKPLAGVPAAMTRLSGVAVTCLAGPSDKAAALVGDLLLGMARNRGIAGFVTDGMVRDLEGIIGVGLPVFCAGLTPNSPARNGPGLVGTPIQIGGLQGDQDGIVIVPRTQMKQVQAKLAEVRAAEAALDAKVRAGLELPDFVQQLLDSGRVHYLD